MIKEKECEEIAKIIFNKYKLREQKIVHSIHVAQIAKFLGEEFIKKGIIVDKYKLYLAGLLHDIGDEARNQDWDLDKHTITGYEILVAENLREIGEIIKKHDVLAHDDKDLTPVTWEEKILNYSDKIEKQTIISINERKRIFLQSFPKEKERINRCFKKVKKMEKEIFGILDFKPKELKERIVLKDHL